MSSLSLSSSDSYSWHEFSNFQHRFGRVYDTISVMESRFEIFRDNLALIRAHNSGLSYNFTMGVNQFSDMTSSEFSAQVSNAYISNPWTKSKCGVFDATSTSVPESWDWREHDAVTPVKDQGQCGSCWSFSASGSIEGAWAIAKSELVSVSEQQMVDCSHGYGNLGCHGGMMDDAFLRTMIFFSLLFICCSLFFYLYFYIRKKRRRKLFHSFIPSFIHSFFLYFSL